MKLQAIGGSVVIGVLPARVDRGAMTFIQVVVDHRICAEVLTDVSMHDQRFHEKVVETIDLAYRRAPLRAEIERVHGKDVADRVLIVSVSDPVTKPKRQR